MLRKGDSGPLVKALQDALLELGEKLPRWGADGSMNGDETLGAFASLLRKHGRTPGGPAAITDDEIAYVYALRAQLAAPGLTIPNLIDRRAFAGLTDDGGPRSWDLIKGWCLHQTACPLHASTDIARCDHIGAHYVVYPDGRVFKLHDIERIIWHGNGWNGRTIGIEIDGLFAGVEGVPATVWRDPTSPHLATNSVTPAQVTSVRAIILSDRESIIRHGGKPEVIVAHRQSSSSRRDDPGSKVWQDIAIPLLSELGLDDGGPGFAIPDGFGGMPIPVEWDPTRTGYHY